MSSAIAKVKEAVLHLYRVCDRAATKDNVGFNGRDADYGNSLGIQIESGVTLTKKQLLIAHTMLKTYEHTQLKQNSLQLPTREELENEIDHRDINKELNLKASLQVKVIRENIRVFFDYNERLLSVVKAIKPKGTFKTVYNDGVNLKFWEFPMSALETVYSELKDYGFNFDGVFMAEIKALEKEREQNIILKSKIIKFVDKWLAKFSHTFKFPNGSELKPFAHQIENIKFMASRTHLKGAILADSQGLGKSFSACLTARFLKDFHKFDSGVVPKIFLICPKAVKDDWTKSAAVCGLKIELYSWGKLPAPPESSYILVADEAHYIQDWTSARTKKLVDLAQNRNCLHSFLLTGTPMKNGRPSNIYPLLAAIGHPIAKDKRAFELRYCNAHPTAFTQWDITGAAFLDELSEKISDGLIRHTKEECLDLPEKVRVIRDCEYSKDAEKTYNEGLTELKKDYRERVAKKEISDKGQAIVFLGYLRRLNSILKTGQVIELTKELLDNNESVVIFTEFRESAQIIAREFGVIPFTGELEDEDRQRIKEEFQAGVTKVFVGTIKAGGVGITLTRSCYNLIVDYPWTPGDLQQAEDRIHRIGQTRTSFIYNFHAQDIDLVMAAVLGQKSENIQQVLQKRDIDLSTVDDDGFYEELLQKLLK